MYAPPDILLEYFPNDTVYVGAFVGIRIILQCFGKSSVRNVPVELSGQIRLHFLPDEPLHSKVFLEAESEKLKFQVPACQFCYKLSVEQIGVGSGDENAVVFFLAEPVYNCLKPSDILNLINEQILDAGSS